MEIDYFNNIMRWQINKNRFYYAFKNILRERLQQKRRVNYLEIIKEYVCVCMFFIKYQ